MVLCLLSTRISDTKYQNINNIGRGLGIRSNKLDGLYCFTLRGLFYQYKKGPYSTQSWLAKLHYCCDTVHDV